MTKWKKPEEPKHGINLEKTKIKERVKWSVISGCFKGKEINRWFTTIIWHAQASLHDTICMLIYFCKNP